MAGEQPRLDLSSCTQAVLAPGVLRAFGATHTSIGGAFSEIIDNFVDAGATYVDISLRKYRLPERPGQDDGGAACRRDVRQMLVISGDGKGCDARESLMVGRSEKNLAASRTIGGYGLGGQSSLMFLAEDALVLSMQAGGRATASLMSGTLHAEQGIADRLLTPHFAHRVPEGLLLPPGEEEDGEEYDSDYAPEPPDCEGDEAANLEAIYRYSPCRDWPALWRELAWFRRNKTKTGYRVLLYNLKNMSTTERPGDILGISDETDRSLRHVLRYKYLRPRLAVVLQGVKVLPVFWEGLLARATRETFQLGPNQITVLMGFNPSRAPGQRQHQLHSFLCVYVLGRLIRVYELRSELRLSSKGSAYGSGLCVIVDDTQGYLPLGMNKESVKAGAEFSTLKDELKERVKTFWKVCKGGGTITHLNERLEGVQIPIPFQVHDDRVSKREILDYEPADASRLNLYTFEGNTIVPEDPSRAVDCFTIPPADSSEMPSKSTNGRLLYRGIQYDTEGVEQQIQGQQQSKSSLTMLAPQRWSRRVATDEAPDYTGLQEEGARWGRGDDGPGAASARRGGPRGPRDPYSKLRKRLKEFFKDQPKYSCIDNFYHERLELNRRTQEAKSSNEFAVIIAKFETLVLAKVKSKLWLGDDYIIQLRDQGFLMGMTRDEWLEKLFSVEADLDHLEACIEDFSHYCTSPDFVSNTDKAKQNTNARDLAQATLRRLKMSQVTRLSQPPSDLSNSSVLQDVPSVAVENGLLVQQQDGWLNTATSTKSDFEGAALQQHGQGIGLATSSYGMSYHPNSTCQIPATTNNRSDQEDVSIRQPKAGRIDKPSTARSSGAKMSMRGQLLHQNTFQPQEQGPAVDHHQGIVSGQQEAVCGTIIDVSNTDQDDTHNVSHNTFLSNKQQGKQQQQQHKENNWHLEQEIQYCVPDIAVPSNVCPKKDGRECVLDQSPIECKNVKRKSAPENDPVLIAAEQDHTKVVDSRPKKAKTTAKLLAALEAYSIDL